MRHGAADGRDRRTAAARPCGRRGPVGCDAGDRGGRGCASTRRGRRWCWRTRAALPFRRAFDAVFSGATFHWIHDHAALFRSIITALQARRPAGRAVRRRPEPARLLYGRAERLMREPRFARYFEDWTEPTYFADVESTRRRLAAPDSSTSRCRSKRRRRRSTARISSASSSRTSACGTTRAAAERRAAVLPPRSDGRGRGRFAAVHARLLAAQHRPGGAPHDAGRLVPARGSRTGSAKRDAANARGTIVSRFRLVSLSRRRRADLVGPGRRRRPARARSPPAPPRSWCSRCWSSGTRASSTKSSAPRPRSISTRSGLARLARDWNALPEVPAPPDLDFDAHPYARDLDLFGHASLDQVVRPAGDERRRAPAVDVAADAGPRRMIIRDRQAAVDELARGREWRETLAMEGSSGRR